MSSLAGNGGETGCMSGPRHRNERIRSDELSLRMPDGQDRAWRHTHDTLGDAAHQHVCDGAAAMSAHDHDVDFGVASVVDDRGGRIIRFENNGFSVERPSIVFG